jgi:adenylate kinase
LDVYNAQTAPLIEYYTKKGLIFDVDGSTTPEYVFEKVAQKLNEF